MKQVTNSAFAKLLEYEKRSSDFAPNEQVRGAADTINRMARSFGGMARRSNESSEVALRSVAIAHNDSQMVQQTIRGMDTIRDQIQETSKRIKRLGEALKRIGSVSRDLSSMIEDISQEAQAQSEVAMQIADQMNSIRDVSIQTSDSSKQTAKSMGRLADLVYKLSDSVADFKLPQPEGPGRDA